MTEHIHKVSDKLTELIEFRHFDGLTQRRNEGNELLNEDGLPMVDITEPSPENDADSSQCSEPVPFIMDDTLRPLTSLSSSERARRKLECDLLLDLLEQEERIEQQRCEEQELVQRSEAQQKRKDTANAKLENLKAARDMQKRMGKALLQDMAEVREREDKAQKEILAQGAEKERKVVQPPKSVSFADLPFDVEDPVDRTRIREKEVMFDRGDVTLARLTNGGSRLIRNSRVHGLPMKNEVVERVPGLRSDNNSTDAGDSDDESLSASPADSDADGIDDSTDIDGISDHDSVLAEEYGLDNAGHQREIALEYYEKQATIGQEVAKAMSHAQDENDWNQDEVPLDATLSAPHPKPSMSRFKADRLAALSASSAPSRVLPASTSSTIQRAIRTGKLEYGSLIGGHTSDEDAEDDNVEEVLDLLRKCEVRNTGTTVDHFPHEPLPTPFLTSPAPAISASKPANPKHKLARTLGIQAPSSTRSIAPVTSSVVLDRGTVHGSNNPELGNGFEPVPPPMTVDSQSLNRSSGVSPPVNVANSPSSTTRQTVIASPSFPPPSRRPLRPPIVMSSTVHERRRVSTNPIMDVRRSVPERKLSKFMANRS